MELCLLTVACCRCQLDQGAFSEACSCHSTAAAKCPHVSPELFFGVGGFFLPPSLHMVATGHTWPPGLAACALDSDSAIGGVWLSLSRWLLWLLLQGQSVPSLLQLIPMNVRSPTFVSAALVPAVGIRVPLGGRIVSRLPWAGKEKGQRGTLF